MLKESITICKWELFKIKLQYGHEIVSYKFEIKIQLFESESIHFHLIKCGEERRIYQ